MSVPAAYLAVIAIWSTTPITIKWSSEGSSFVAGVTGRMLIGTVICLVLMKLLRIVMPWHRQAVQAYLAGSLAVFAGMLTVYWGAQYIDSGLVALLFGLSPLATTVIAVAMGTESRPGPMKLLGIVTALGGLFCVVSLGSTSLSNSEYALYGMIAVFIAMLFHSVSTVWVKQAGQGLSALSMTTGSLLVSMPMYLLVWWFVDGTIPQQLPPVHALGSIVYLGIFGSVLGYLFYFYTLRHVSASSVALIPLITPVTALFIGQAFNGEQVTAVTWFGTGLIILGLSMHQWGHRFRLKPA